MQISASRAAPLSLEKAEAAADKSEDNKAGFRDGGAIAMDTLAQPADDTKQVATAPTGVRTNLTKPPFLPDLPHR